MIVLTISDNLGINYCSHWPRLPFVDCVEVLSDKGKRVEQRDYAQEGLFPVIDQGEGLIGGYANDSSLLFDGPLPVVLFGDHTRRVKFVEFPFVIGAQGVKILRPLSCWLPRFLAYLLSTAPILDRGYSRHFQFIRMLDLPIPPLPEQRRIVEEIEKQFSRLDEGVANLKRVKANLKRYRASALQAACEGRLVPTEADLARQDGRGYEPASELLKRILVERRRKWEETELAKMRAKGKEPTDDKWKSRYQEPAAPDTSGLPELPQGWVWASVEQLSTKVVDGVHKKPNYIDTGIPFVTIRNMTSGPGIDFYNLNHISSDDHALFIQRANPERGDILVSKDGTLGVITVVRTDKAFSIFVSVAMIKPVTYDMSEYLEVALSSSQMQLQMVPKGSGLQHIHLEDLRADCVPLSPIAEQYRIVDEVKRRLSVIEKIEMAVEANLKRAERLRQSILKRAFEGKLVPQDPNDEPAGALLTRIRTEHLINSQSQRKQNVSM